MNDLPISLSFVNPQDVFETGLAVPVFLEQVVREKRAEGESRLWWAVLTDAVEIHAGRTKDVPALQVEYCREWFASDSEGVGSFNFVCAMLRLEREYVLRLMAEGEKHMGGAL